MTAPTRSSGMRAWSRRYPPCRRASLWCFRPTPCTGSARMPSTRRRWPTCWPPRAGAGTCRRPCSSGSVRAAAALTESLGAFGQDLIDEFWPGPLTLVFRASPTLMWDLGDTLGTVAVRMPLHPIALDLLSRTGPMAVSSANRHSLPAATTADEAQAQLGDGDLRLPGRRAVRGQRSVHDPRPDRDGAADAARGRALRRRPQEGRPGDRPARRVGGAEPELSPADRRAAEAIAAANAASRGQDADAPMPLTTASRTTRRTIPNLATDRRPP